MKLKKLRKERPEVRFGSKAVWCHETRKKYSSISAAAEEHGVKPIQISRVCHRERHTVHGLTFSFI
jgi:hypothetical protein